MIPQTSVPSCFHLIHKIKQRMDNRTLRHQPCGNQTWESKLAKRNSNFSSGPSSRHNLSSKFQPRICNAKSNVHMSSFSLNGDSFFSYPKHFSFAKTFVIDVCFQSSKRESSGDLTGCGVIPTKYKFFHCLYGMPTFT